MINYMLNPDLLSKRQLLILKYISAFNVLTPSKLISLVSESIDSTISQMTLSRDLKPLIEDDLIERLGKGPAVKYQFSSKGSILAPIDLNAYFETETDLRNINERFNFDLFQQLKNISIFSENELKHLNQLDQEFKKQKKELSPLLLKKEFERVTIEISWKSSAIEGNTYTLLETETLLQEGIQAKGKKAEEAQMILNHKIALDFLRSQLQIGFELNVTSIEKIHSLLTTQSSVSKNLRKTLVGFTGTKYRPLENQFQIKEALENTCHLINIQKNCFAKSLLAIALISYIQPFEDGNKRCGRIIGNSILLESNSFPLSFRSVDTSHYKKAILLFYEKNNLSALKKIFIEQSEFSVKNYFRSSN